MGLLHLDLLRAMRLGEADERTPCGEQEREGEDHKDPWVAREEAGCVRCFSHIDHYLLRWLLQGTWVRAEKFQGLFKMEIAGVGFDVED